MTDRETAIRGLEDLKMILIAYPPTEEYKREGIMEINCAIKALKEQEPIKPTVAADTWICSKCGHSLESQYLIDDKENPQVLVHELYQYCPNCGRAVKWDAAD